MHRKTLPLIALLALGCSSMPGSQITHEVNVQRHVSDFHQTLEVEAWSIRTQTDDQGNRWPSGSTLNARFIQHHDRTQQRFLMLRKDERSNKQAPAIYDEVRERRASLPERCKDMTLVQDGQTIVLPVHVITVRALTNAARMPTPPTDSRSNPVESLVGTNTSEQFVISTTVQALVEPGVWQRLASAQSLHYELCGEVAAATDAELEALREVVADS